MGYKSKVDSSSMFGSNSKIVEEEVSRKKIQYQNNAEIMQLSKHCEMEKIKFRIKVLAGHSPKVVALRAAVNLEATWVILDRQMKKDKKYFMEKLSCGISGMKRDNTIEQLRGPKATESTKVMADKMAFAGYVSYGEMIPGSPKEELSPQKSPSTQETTLGIEQSCNDGTTPSWDTNHSPLSKSSFNDQTLWSTISSSMNFCNTEVSSSSFTEVKSSSPLHFHEDVNATNTEQEGAPKESTFSLASSLERVHSVASEQTYQVSDRQTTQEYKPEQEFHNAVCSVCKNKRPKAGWKGDFTYADLQEATDGFSEKNFLSEGGFGCVYRGELKNGLKVAVKQHKDASFQGEKEFKSEVHVLSKARHQNLVMLLGSCSKGSHRLLVYEYVCNGSLDQHLSRHKRRPLSWEKRIKIALGAAKGLKFLHENNILHRDMRPNNILVTHDHESLLGDFGLARNQYDDLEQSSENSLVGTFGYLAPEYAECGKASTKTDVYSFGVVLLQLITGLRTTDKELEGKSLVGWARPLLKEKNYPGLIDKRIGDSHDVHQLFWMVRVAEKCLNLDPSKRYTMERVVNTLHYIIEGNTTCIKDFSPTQSGSVNSATGSAQSQDDVDTNERNNFDTKVPSSSSTISSLSTSFSNHVLITTTNISTSSERLLPDSEKHYEKKKVVLVGKGEVLYDEMII